MYILASAYNSEQYRQHDNILTDFGISRKLVTLEQYRQHGNILNNFRISRKLVRLIKMYVNKTCSNIHVG